MKFKSIIAAFICSLTIISCSNELEQIETSNDNAKSSNSSISKVSFPGSGLADMLCFPSMQDFYYTQTDLEAQVEDHDASFEAQFGNLSEDDLIDYEENTGFDDELPLTEFENSFSFSSLRVHLIDAENAWLDQFGPNDSFDVSDSPYHHFIMDEAQRALLNVDAQAKIGEYLIQFTRFGYIQVPVNNMELFLSVVNDPTGSSGWMTDENVTIVGGYYGSPDGNFDPQSLDPDTSGVYCTTDVDAKGQIVYTDNRKVSWEHKLRGGYIVTKAKAKTRGFKYKRGKWRCRRLHVYAEVDGDISDNQNIGCTISGHLDDDKFKKRRKVWARDNFIHGYGFLLKYEAINRETKSVHGYSNNFRTDKYMLDI